MASTVQTVSSRVVTRTWRDIDPKIVGVFAVAIATIALVAAAYVVAAVLGADLGPGLASAAVPVVVAAVVGYARRSKHAELIDQGVDVAAAIAIALEPVVEAAAPEAKPAVAAVVRGVEEIAAQIDPHPSA